MSGWLGDAILDVEGSVVGVISLAAILESPRGVLVRWRAYRCFPKCLRRIAAIIKEFSKVFVVL